MIYTIEVLELRYILVHAEMNGCVRQDFRSKMEAQRSLFKNSSIMGCFHQMRVFQRVLFKRYNCMDLQDWLIDSWTIAAGSVSLSQAFEGRHYYRSLRLHKEEFDALVQWRVEDTTNKFEHILPIYFISISNTNNSSWCTSPDVQFHDKENHQSLQHFYSEK